MDDAAGKPVPKREVLAPPSPKAGHLCGGRTWAPGGLDLHVHVLTLLVFSIESVAEHD